jgi:RNA ligase
MKLNKKKIDELVDTGYLNRTKHPDKDLYILKYSRNCQYENEWNEITMMARGLVVDGDYNIIALPFKKFFNIEQHNVNELPIKDGYEVFEKMDGSLGIFFFYDGEWHVATSGSFISDQAVKGRGMLSELGTKDLDKSKTYLFEIIFKSNRIVVDYNDREELVLLAAIETESGVEMSYNKLVENYNKIYSIVPRYDNATDLMKLKGLDLVNKEGFVVRFKNGLRIKIKFAEYVRLHAILTQMSNLVIWRSLRWGHDLDLVDVPDEFDEWVRDTMKDLLAEFGRVKYEINKRYYSIIRSMVDDENLINSRKNIDNRAFVTAAKEYGKEYFDYLMMKFNQKDIDDIIWRELRPTYSLPFLEEEV